MLRAVLLFVVVGLVAAVAAAIAAWTYFGLTGVGGVVVATLAAVPVLVKLLGGRLFASALKAPFKLKGQPLRGARVRVHAVRRASPVARPEPEGDTPAEPRDWYTVELTITPAAEASAGPFKFWAPIELVLVAPDADPEDPDDGEWGEIHKARVWTDGQWEEADDQSLGGEQRLRLVVGVRPGCPRVLRLRYYFEVFGHVDLARARHKPA